MSITILQLHKRASYKFKNIQDKFAFNEANKCFALSDGTTQSFNSENWAEIITKHFVANPTFNKQMLINDFTNCVQEYKNSKFEFSTNPAKASLEKTKQNKGGTATFIGLQFLQDNHFNVISCGDTNLFVISNDKVEYFPYSEIENLDANNFFINTEQLIQNKIDETYFQTKTFSFHNNDTILLATDALSRLLLKQPSVASELTAINDFETLHKFCLTYWDKKEMEEDDISAIIIKVESKNKIQQILPPKDFSFPEEEENPFVPTPPKQQETFNPFSDMNIQEIKHNFSGITNDFQQLKKKMKLQEMLLMIAISIGFLNLLCFFYFRPDSEKVEKENPKQKTENTIIDNFNQSFNSLTKKIDALEKKVSGFSKSKKDEVKAQPKHEKKPQKKTEKQDTISKTDKSNTEK